MIKSFKARGALAASVVFAGAFGLAGLVSADPPPPPAAPNVAYVQQDPTWAKLRDAFYTQDQGSRMIPLAWAKALTKDDKPFLRDSLTRYGYLANPNSDKGLPIGFTASGPLGSESLGMTCAACHTREIDVGGTTYRVDGGPALSDFYALLTDLRDAVGRARGADFPAFSAAVLGANPQPAQITALKADLDLWFTRQDTLFSHAFPQGGWGVGRLDAVSMILNRLTGLDIGTAPNRIIATNIYRADAPVRYPFIWNAPRQDFTQWPGFAPNGDDVFGLVRNLGEVYGVFADFAPKKDPLNLVLGANYVSHNSANFDGLTSLEKMVRKIPPPKWPFAIVAARRDSGARIFARATAQGGCAECHEVNTKDAQPRILPPEPVWATPLVDAGTDVRQYDLMKRTAGTGVLKDTGIPFKRLKATETQFDILVSAVAGSILQNIVPFSAEPQNPLMAHSLAAGDALAPAQQNLLAAFSIQAPVQSGDGTHKYESRVLDGIWATAPYLHNGSVASLAELLTPSAQRLASFDVGPAYDIEAVGLAAEQHGVHAKRNTTGCDDIKSGNSHCGHDWGTTTLKPDEKKDLIEYLKSR